MIVKYVRERGYKGRDQDPFLTLSKDYIVLGLNFDTYMNKTMFTIQGDDDGTPILCEVEFFDIVDSHLPPNCVVERSKNYITVEPKEFIGDFWEQYHDSDETAEATFEEVLRRLQKFHKWPVKMVIEYDFVEQILKDHPQLKQDYDLSLDIFRNPYNERVSVNVKLKSLGKVILSQLEDNTLLPEIFYDLLHALENYAVFFETIEEKEGLNNALLQELILFLTKLNEDDPRFRYFNLFKNNLGPALEDLIRVSNNKLLNNII